MSNDPLEWLVRAQRELAGSAAMWLSVEERLRDALADLRDGTFRIVHVRWPAFTGSEPPLRYLQFAVIADASDRVLVAQASANRFQAINGPVSAAQQERIDSLGWVRAEDGNHERVFDWPLGIDACVADSMAIVRDVWGVANPSFLQWDEILPFSGPAPDRTELLPAESPSGALSRIVDWLADLDARTAPVDPDQPQFLWATVDDALVVIQVDPQVPRARLLARLGEMARTPSSVEVLDATELTIWVGAVERVGPDPDGSTSLALATTIPLEGLTRAAFVQLVSMLVESAESARDWLTDAGVLRRFD